MTSTENTPRAVVPLPDRGSHDLLTLVETAEILRVPVNTLRWWRQRGTGPVFFKIGRHLVTTVGDDVRRFIEVQRRGSGATRTLDGSVGAQAVRPMQ